MALPDIRTADVAGKKVLLRADTDVPMENGEIADDARLQAWFPTLQYLLDQKAIVIICGKLGRPEGVDENLSLLPVAKWLGGKFRVQSSEFRMDKTKIGEFDGWEITPKFFLLENLQFYPGEKANTDEFAKNLASLADIYVNDAFAVCHRNHASVVGIPKYIPSFAGFRLQEEVRVLGNILSAPQRPLVVVIGGAKIETKLPLVGKMCSLADAILVCGKIAQERDVLLSAERACEERCAMLVIADLNFHGTDVSGRSLAAFIDVIQRAKTVVWNGPVGQIRNSKFEIRNYDEDTESGTRELAKAIAESGAYTIVGGGETLEFVKKIGLRDKFSFTSTGGGAMLAFLSGEKLPGLEALLRSLVF